MRNRYGMAQVATIIVEFCSRNKGRITRQNRLLIGFWIREQVGVWRSMNIIFKIRFAESWCEGILKAGSSNTVKIRQNYSQLWQSYVKVCFISGWAVRRQDRQWLQRDLMLWHKQFGHLSWKDLTWLKQNQMIDGLNEVLMADFVSAVLRAKWFVYRSTVKNNKRVGAGSNGGQRRCVSVLCVIYRHSENVKPSTTLRRMKRWLRQTLDQKWQTWDGT